MIAEELLVLNPLLYDDLEKYIWIDDSYEAHCNAQILFHYLLQKRQKAIQEDRLTFPWAQKCHLEYSQYKLTVFYFTYQH